MVAASPETFSNFGRIRLRNSWTSCPSTSPWPPSRAASHNKPQVSKAMLRISSAIEKSKTSSRACAVCATNGAYILPSSSTKVCTQATAFCRSSTSEVLMIMTLILPFSSVMERFTSSSSANLPIVSWLYSFGERVNFSKMPGRMCGTKGKKSPFIVAQMRCEASNMYSFTGSLLGRLGTCVAWIMICMMPSASPLKPSVPTEAARSEMHSRVLPRSMRSSDLCKSVCTRLLRTGIKGP
mmetsp:Transcript_86819/g.250531  ORF Transcript_86819/g.250531 Transcript_86819/m.250531 type:complete len:239 (+) Transcript_86819:981-1697(+)